MSRTVVNRLPGHVVYDGITVYSESGWTVEIGEEVFPVTSGRFGFIGNQIGGKMVTIKGIPEQFNAAALPKLFPFGSMALGSSIFGLSDKPLVIYLTNGTAYTVPCVGVFKEPGMVVANGKPLLGEMEWRGIVGVTSDAKLMASFFAKTTIAYPGDTTWNPTEKVSTPWTCSWSQASGATAWDDIDTSDGFAITTAATIDDSSDKSQRGIINMPLTDYRVSASANPMNISVELILAKLFQDAPLGSMKGALGRDLKLRSGGGAAFIYLKNAALKGDTNFFYGVQKRPMDALSWEAEATFTTGVKDPLLVLSVTDPDEEEE